MKTRPKSFIVNQHTIEIAYQNEEAHFPSVYDDLKSGNLQYEGHCEKPDVKMMEMKAKRKIIKKTKKMEKKMGTMMKTKMKKMKIIFLKCPYSL